MNVVESAAVRTVSLWKRYGGGDTQVDALADVSVEFGRGRFTAIMGPSGSGKSTLLHCVAGLDRPTHGQAFLGDVELTRLPEKQLTQLRRDRIGFVFQAFNLVPTLTALENITLPLDLAGRKPDLDWLTTVVDTIGLTDRLSHKPSELSGGQQQRVCIARALVNQPNIVFADEQTGNLDSHTGEAILNLFRKLSEQGRTIALVTHDPEIAAVTPRRIEIRDGKIANQLDPKLAGLDRLEATASVQASDELGART